MQIRRHELRFISVFLFLIACFGIFIVKLILIQVFKSAHLAQLAQKQHNQLIELEPVRGNIYDRNLRPLAMSVVVHSLYANPRIMSPQDKARALEILPNLLAVDAEKLQGLLSRDKFFVWIKRKLPVDLAEEVRSQQIRGLSFIDESKRFYPNGSLAAHVIGFADIDNNGLEGIELVYDRYLKGKAGKAIFLRDAKQRNLMLSTNFISPQDGMHIVLTIDETIQYIAERALDEAFKKHKAKSATIIVTNPRTGEILALANRPTYDLERVGQSNIEDRTNRAVSYVYEPGSVFKIVTAAAALEEQKFVETDEIFCENGKYRVGNHTLRDHKPHGTLTFQEVFEKSSNIGVCKIAQTLGPDVIYNYGRRFRFGMLTQIELRGEVDGWLKDPSQWSKTTISAIPMGHEVTVTPLQMLGALSVIANDGYYMRLHIVKHVKDKHDQFIKSARPEIVDRVVSESTAHRVRDIMVGVVERGTAKRAQIDGVPVAGKTGTAQKVIDGQYSHSQFYASFVAFA
ncbi:MAG: penicillin-binding protein 2, partial [Candidatus Omnitrophica bacterium]|nr:penicillin-binding protein 2 [Candidatus Omnitrophota bacterium]